MMSDDGLASPELVGRDFQGFLFFAAVRRAACVACAVVLARVSLRERSRAPISVQPLARALIF